MSHTPSVLIIEDSLPQANLYQQYLAKEPLNLLHASTGTEARTLIEQHAPELLLLDLKLPDDDGQSILQWVQEHQFPCAVVVITGHSSVEVAVEVIQMGADDFIEKPVTADRLRTTTKNLLEKQQLRQLVGKYQEKFERNSYEGFIGGSLPMQAVYQIIDAAAPSKASVFITGESGTGKEVCAEAIHKRGKRNDKPFIAINCAAIPRDLMESEIFGHVKGAFTGAANERKGAASMADGGTLFLDEIAEMDLDLQTKLLRFVQTGSFRRVGGSKEEQVDVRFICATNRDPLEAVKNGTFREDLYYRLHVVPIQLPALRERGEDILPIAQHFLEIFAAEEEKKFKSLSSEVEVTLRRYDWPGNIRQLQNVIRNIVVLHDGDVVEKNHLPPPLNHIDTLQMHGRAQGLNGHLPTDGESPSHSPSDQIHMAPDSQPHTPEGPSGNQMVRPLAMIEREVIEQAITLCEGNIPRAASLLEVSPSTIYRKKQAWEAV